MDAAKTLDEVNQNQAELSRALAEAENRAGVLEKANEDIKADLKRMQEAHVAAAARPQSMDPAEKAIRQFIASPENDASFISGARRGTFARHKDSDTIVQLRSHSTKEHGRRDGLLDSEPKSEWQRELQVAVTNRNYIRMHQKDPHTPQSDAELLRVIRQGPKGAADTLERIFVSGVGVAADTIFDVDMPVLERYIDNNLRISSIFETVQMSAPTISMPFLTRGVRPYLKRIATAADPDKFITTTGSSEPRTFTAKGMAFRMQADEDATEDSFLDWLGYSQELMARAIIDGEEDVIVNGDTDATHQDAVATWDPRGLWGGADAGILDHRRHSIGLRARAFDVSNTADQGAALTINQMRDLRASLDTPQAALGGVYITSQEVWLKQLLKLEDFKELHSHGSGATMINGQLNFNGAAVLRGQVGSIDGVPVLVSNLMTSDLAATGLHTGTGALSGVIYCSPERFKRMVLRSQRIESARDITRGVVNSVATVRWLFAQLDGAAEKNVAYGFNV